MGLRGPGAKPVKKSSDGEQKALNKPDWQRKGLSRPERMIRFIEGLRITSGAHAGKAMKLRPWQKEIIREIYRTDKKARRIKRQALITLPRKNGKTQLVAALCLAHLCGPEAIQRGQCYSAAADRDQASLIFREMCAFIDADPELSERVIVRQFKKELEDAENGSTYTALSSDARKAHGLSPSFVCCDELAQWKGRELYDNLVSGVGAHAEPLVVSIGTQSSDAHNVMSELTDYAEQVRDGVVEDPAFAGIIYRAPEDADPWDESTWYGCNPALNDFRSLEEMRDAAAKAQRIPARESAFRNLYLNQRVEQDTRFIAAADWQACAAEIDPEALRGRRCFGGLDLSSTQDLTSLQLYFPDDAGAVLSWFWCPGDNLVLREENDRVPYQAWSRQGHIEPTGGKAVNKLAIVRRLAEVASMFELEALAYDRWRLEDLKRLLGDEGVDLPLVGFGQGYAAMGPAVDALETAILARDLQHSGNPVLTWNVSNAVITSDPAGSRKLDKSRARERIDGLVALVMAVGIHSKTETPKSYDFGRRLVLSA